MKGIDITGKEDNTWLLYESLYHSQLPTTNRKTPKSNMSPYDPIHIWQMWSELYNIWCLYHQLRAVLTSVCTNGYSLWNLNSHSMPNFSTYYYNYFYLMPISGIWWYLRMCLATSCIYHSLPKNFYYTYSHTFKLAYH